MAIAIEWRVVGLSAELKENVDSHLATLLKKQKKYSDHLLVQVEQRVRQAIQAQGYYQPQHLSITPKKNRAAKFFLQIDINPGKPVIIVGTHILLKGEAETDSAYQNILQHDLPQQGDILRHSQFDKFVDKLSQLAAQRGYFDAKIINAELQVNPNRNQATWVVDFDSGRRYCFGEIILRGSQINEEFINALIPFKSGEHYHADNLLKLSQRLTETQWFTSVNITPEFEIRENGGCLPILLLVSPRLKNNIEVGGGYSTDDGPGARISWRKPWINSLGHSIESQLKITKHEQQFRCNYRLPLVKEPLEQFYLFSASVENQKRKDTVSKAVTLDAARHWGLRGGWRPTVAFHWRRDFFTQGHRDPMKTFLLYPEINLSRLRQRGGLMPEWGDNQRYSIDCSEKLWLSSVSFTRFQLYNTWIRSFKKDHRCLLRFNAGWIKTSDFSSIPTPLRFFAGGDGSIRGYPYHSISPKNLQGELTGASKLVTTAIEYNYRFADSFWLALFMDSGLASHQLTRKTIKRGAGIGIRWDSPIGPIKLDIARALNDKQQRKTLFYLALGSEL